VLIDISCPYGRISYAANKLEKVSLDKKEKYSKRAQETIKIPEMHLEMIPTIVSSLRTVHATSLEALRNLL
jgi:hypothetical protein